MIEGTVRALAICVFRKGDQILVAEYFDPSKNEIFYRPLGGAIEFGETSEETIVRELREELGAEIRVLRHLGVVENIFTYNGKKGHEVVLVYDCEFADESFYNSHVLSGREDDDTTLKVVWKSLDYFQKRNAPLYPDGVLGLLTEKCEVHQKAIVHRFERTGS